MTEPAIQFRKSFRADRILFIREHGATAFDQARALYVCRKTGEQVVFSDAFYGDQDRGDFAGFLERLVDGWWSQRRAFKTTQDDLDLELVSGIYAHFLPEVGYDYTIEFDEDGPVRCWRVDAAGRANKLSVPKDDTMFHGQTGTFFDLHAGWRSMMRRFETEKRLVVSEVEPGYYIGIRPGIPGDRDPAGRHDPDLEHAFSQRVDYGFDTIEFLESEDARLYPIENERYGEWLAQWDDLIRSGQCEPFVLADSGRFSAAIDELCELRHIEPHFTADHDRMSVRLTKGDVTLDLELGDLFLRCLHTGRTFESGARTFVVPSLDLVDDAYSLFLQLTERLESYEVKVESGSLVTAHDGAQEIGRWSLFDFTGRDQAHGSNAVDGVLRLMGFDPETGTPIERSSDLETCPVCGAPARVEKVIRPTTALGVDSKTLVGVPIGEHTVYYTLDCPLHSTPLHPAPGMTLGDYESAYQSGLERANLALVHQQTLPDSIPGQLLVGHGVGSLVLEPGRIRAVVSALGADTTEERHVYGVFPDVLVVSERALTDVERHRVRVLSREILETVFPDRTWTLGIARTVSLDTPALGSVDFVSA